MADLLSDKDILEKADKWWRYALDHPTWRDAKLNHIKCFQYKEGDQWTPGEKKELEARGQPDTVNNQVSITVNKLMGDLVDRKYRIGFSARNGDVDQPVADALSDIFLYIRQSNKLQFEETDMAEDGFTCGFGVMEVYVEFDEMNQPEIKVQSEDSLVVWPDPDWRRYDWNQDCRFIARARWFDSDYIEEKYPKAKARLREMASSAGATDGAGTDNTVDTFRNEYYIDEKKRKIRLIDMEYKSMKREVIVLFNDPSGQMPFAVPKKEAAELIAQAEANNIPMEEIDRVRKTVNRVVFIGGLVLEHKELRTKYFSLIPYVMFRRKTGGPYSLISIGLSLQDAINKRESKALHLLNTNQTVAERGAVLDPDKFQEEIHKPDGLVIVNDGALAGERVLFRNNLELAQTQFSMHQSAIKDFRDNVGVDPRAPIDTGELRGSAALNRKFTEIGKPVARIFENFSRSRNLLGDVLLNFVQEYITPQKVMMITDDEKKSRAVALNPDIVNKIKQAQYDVTITDFLDTTSVQQEQFGLLLQYLPQILPFGPFWVKKLIQLSDIRDKDKFMAEMDAMQAPPPNKPRISLQANITDLIPEERAFVWQDAGSPQVAQAVIQAQPMTTTATKLAGDLAKTKITADHTKEIHAIDKKAEFAGKGLDHAHEKALAASKKEKDDDKDPK